MAVHVALGYLFHTMGLWPFERKDKLAEFSVQYSGRVPKWSP